MKLGVWFGIIVSAMLAFGIAYLYKQPIHWYLFIILIVVGFFIHTIILILKMSESDDHTG